METRHRGFAGKLCVFSLFKLFSEIYRQNEAQEELMGINTWYTAAMVTNAGGFGAPAVSRSNSAGWQQFGHEMHAGGATVAFAKSEKNTVFGPKYGFFGILALFWMMSA